MASFVNFIEWITRFFGYVAAWMILPLTLSMVWEVFSRYVLSAPTFWAYEIAYMLMGASLMLGIAYTLQLRRHIRVDFVYDMVTPKQRALIDVIGYIFFLLPVVLWMLWGLWDYLAYAYETNEVSGESAWNPVVWPFRITLVFGFFLFMLQIIVEIIKGGYVIMGQEPPGWSEAEDHGSSGHVVEQ
ncbi:MAG: TRAP transporter small permease subunit [Alphaproteobacteria bacterium]|jgi:TRAP-type mannitol/chloroaromatic compound transport system permease small subunit|nr:TRAP transporter small permease subunit [Alphaproteobacteria bacterium]